MDSCFQISLIVHGYLVEEAPRIRRRQTVSGGFEPNNSTNAWTLIDVDGNVTQQIPVHGAGCNVPALQRGYYLGGATTSSDRSVQLDGDGNVNATASVDYLHVIHVFDTQNESMSVLPVPDSVPVVNQSMVWLDTGNMHGALAVLGGYTEQNGTLDIVRSVDLKRLNRTLTVRILGAFNVGVSIQHCQRHMVPTECH